MEHKGSTRLTPNQQHFYDIIIAYTIKHSYCPSFRQIMDITGIKSPNGIMCHANALVKKGLLRRDRNTSRSLIPLIDGVPLIEALCKEIHKLDNSNKLIAHLEDCVANSKVKYTNIGSGNQRVSNH